MPSCSEGYYSAQCAVTSYYILLITSSTAVMLTAMLVQAAPRICSFRMNFDCSCVLS
jgi:hypothetical protein